MSIMMMMSQPRKFNPEEEITTVFVGNLAWTTTDDDLRIYCSSIGRIVFSEIKRFPDTGRSKGWGLVQYDSHMAAALAVEKLNMTEFMSRIIHVRFDRTMVDEIENSGGIKVFVGNIPWQVTERGVAEHFRKFSPRRLRIMTNMSGRSRGFALLQYDSTAEAEAAIHALNETDLGGRLIQCRIDRGPGKEIYSKSPMAAPIVPMTKYITKPSSQIVIRNISPLCTDETLAIIFSRFGLIANARVMYHSNGSPKGWGVVTYFNPIDAVRAANMTNGQLIFNDMPPVDVMLDEVKPPAYMENSFYPPHPYQQW